MRLRLLASTLAVITIAALVPSSAQANHSWADYHWARTANPFTVELDDNVTSAWDSYLVTAAADWSASSKLDAVVLQGSFGSRRSCNPATSHVEVCNATYGNTGWLGIASINITADHHITKGSVKVNDTYFNTAQYNTPQWRRLVMCQEVGHTFGLDHQDENFNNPNLGTCMDYTSNPAGPPSNEHPNAHDYAQLDTIYTHLDSFNTTIAPGAAGTLAGDSPASWGKLMRGTAGRGTNVYVRDFGHGNYTVTFVIWA